MEHQGIPRLVLASSMVVYGEGAYTDPRDRAAGQARARAPRPTCAPASTTPATLTSGAILDPRHGHRGRARWIRGTSTRHQKSARSISPPRGHAAPAARRSPCATTTSTVPGCPATHPTPVSPPCSARPWPAARHPGSSKTAPSGAASSMSGTSPPRTSPPPWRCPRGGLAAFRAYNVGAAEVHTIGDVAAALSEFSAGPAPIVTGEYRLGDVRHITASSAPDQGRTRLGPDRGLRRRHA